MYSYLLIAHSIVRWLVLFFILFAISRAALGLIKKKTFSKTDNSIRHWTATVAHIQLMIGITIYTRSPIVSYFWSDTTAAIQNLDITFYGAIHFALMLIAIVVLTIGSALAKRRATDITKFKTMLVWFSVALIIIIIAIPWPFSPLSVRPYLRTF